MPRRSSFKAIESIGRTLPGVEVTTSWGQPTLKVRALLQDDPDTYYLKDQSPLRVVGRSRVHHRSGITIFIRRSTGLVSLGPIGRAPDASCAP